MRPTSAAGGRAIACLAAVWGSLFATLPAAAIEFRGGQHVVVGRDEVVRDDLYATGETVTIEGTVEGDVVASGRELRLRGEVTGDWIAAGQAVVIEGRVGDDVRIAGMALELGPGAAVGDDVVAAGLSLATRAQSAVRGTLLFTGYQALLEGDVEEDLRGSMSGLELRGSIGDGDVEIGGEPDTPSFLQFIPSPVPLPVVPGGLTIAESARIGGLLEYTAASEARGADAGPGTLVRRQPARPASAAAGEVERQPRWPRRLSKWLGLALLGLALAWSAPGWLAARSGEIGERPLALAGVGLVGAAALPVGILLALAVVAILAAILGLVRLGGLAALALVVGLAGLGLLILAFWLTVSYLAPVLAGLCTGRWILERLAPSRASGLALPLLAGLLVLALATWLPWLGLLVGLAVLLLGWGAILSWAWRRVRPAAA